MARLHIPRYTTPMDQVVIKRSAGGIVHRDNTFLALRVREHDEIVFPKGTIEPGETPEQTAVREIFEETGYRVQILEKLGEVTYEFSEHHTRYRKTVHHYLMRLIDTLAPPTPQREDYEDFENVWLTADEAMNCLTHDESRALLQRAVKTLSTLGIDHPAAPEI